MPLTVKVNYILNRTALLAIALLATSFVFDTQLQSVERLIINILMVFATYLFYDYIARRTYRKIGVYSIIVTTTGFVLSLSMLGAVGVIYNFGVVGYAAMWVINIIAHNVLEDVKHGGLFKTLLTDIVLTLLLQYWLAGMFNVTIPEPNIFKLSLTLPILFYAIFVPLAILTKDEAPESPNDHMWIGVIVLGILLHLLSIKLLWLPEFGIMGYILTTIAFVYIRTYVGKL